MTISRRLPASAVSLLVLCACKLHIGPAVGFVWQVNKKLSLGLFSQNIFWSDTVVSNIQPVRFALNPQYNLKNDRGLSEWSVAFTFTALFPTF